MAGAKRRRALIMGDQAAVMGLIRLGTVVRAARIRRRLTQQSLADKVAISRSGLAAIEAGKGSGAPVRVWFALAEALGMPFKADFGRDRWEDPVDAGHLAIQELVLKLGRRAGYTGTFEIPTRPTDPAHATDVRLVPRRAWCGAMCARPGSSPTDGPIIGADRSAEDPDRAVPRSGSGHCHAVV